MRSTLRCKTSYAGRLIPAILLCLCGPAAMGGAVSDPPPEAISLTLEKAVARAREVSPTLAALQAEVSAAEADLRRARAARRPEIGGLAGYRRQSDVPEFSVLTFDGDLLTVFPNIPDTWRLRLDLGVPLYAGGGIAGGVEAARGGDEAARGELRAGISDLVFEVTASYWSLALARRRESVLADAIASYEAHVADIRNLERFGMAARNDVLAVEVERDRASLRRLDAAHAAAVAEADLARLLDLQPGVGVEPAESLEGETVAALETGLDAQVELALATRPERAALAARLSALEARERVERSARRPRVSLDAGYQYSRPNPRFLPLSDAFNDSWDVGVTLAVSLLDGGRRVAAVERAEAESEATRRRLEDLDRRIRLEVTARRLEVQTAREGVRLAERAVAAARENLRVAADRYREGLVPSSERLDAETRLLEAGLDHSAAGARLRVARAALERSLGR